MNLSPHFTLAELTFSDLAIRHGIDNTPNETTIARLGILAHGLEDVRDLLGAPVLISSGYRSLVLNALLKSSPTSAHVLGYASDFKSPAFGSPLKVAQAISGSGIEFDQLIYEFGSWVHLSFDPRMRGERLTIDQTGTRRGIIA
jgi:hypothetical protein